MIPMTSRPIHFFRPAFRTYEPGFFLEAGYLRYHGAVHNRAGMPAPVQALRSKPAAKHEGDRHSPRPCSGRPKGFFREGAAVS